MNTITNTQSLKYYIEPYKNIKINITPSVNQNGILSVDEFGNEIYSLINVGTTKIKSVIGYTSNYADYLLIYNNHNYCLFKDFIVNDKFGFIIHPNTPTKYKINTKISYVENSDDNAFFSINLTNRTIFKLKLNNKEIKDFIYDANGVTISDSSVLDPFENSIEIIHYSTTQNISNSFYITYLGVENRYDLDVQTCEPTFFDNMKALETSESLSDSISRTLLDIGNYHENSENKIVSETENIISLTTYDGSFDLVSIVGDNPFRIVAYDMMADIMLYWAGCRIFSGTGYSVASSGNIKNYSINFEDRVQIFGVSPVVAYGENVYGYGHYSMRVVSSNYGIKIY